MLVIGDALDAVYLGAFLFGLLFSALSLLLGAGHLGGHGPHHGPGPAGLHGHVGHPAHGGHATGSTGSHHGAGEWTLLGALNLGSVLAFLAWFGGIGLLTHHPLGLGSVGSVAAGVVGGAVAAIAVYVFMMRVVLPNDRALDPADYRLPGTIARVSSTIRAGGTGEVVYEQGGTRQVAAARSADGQLLARGVEVVILGCERGIVRVEPWAAFVGDRHPDLIAAIPDGAAGSNPRLGGPT